MASPTPVSPDDVAAAAATLHTPAAVDLVRAVLADRGMTATDVRTSQVLSRPGRREVVRYRVGTELYGPVDVVAVAGASPSSGLERHDLAGHDVGVFVLPDDPALPGLRTASDPELLRRATRLPVLEVRRRRYRPLARAVVEAKLERGRRVWVKALRPDRAADLADVHARCAERVPVPGVVHLDLDLGLVVLSHVPGRDLRALVRREGSDLPDVDEVVALPRDLATVTSAVAVRRTPPLQSVERSVTRLRAVVPEHADRVERLGAAVLAAGTPSPPHLPGPTVHGDLHAAQVQVRHGRVTGLVDLDDAGAGDPDDDLARFLAHLLCTVDRDAAAWARPWASDLHRAVRELVGDDRLVPRVAAVLLSLALGPHRVHEDDWRRRTERRIDVVTHWVGGGTGILPPDGVSGGASRS